MTEQEYWYTRYAEEQQFREAQHAATMVNIEKQYGYWQLCPKCDGEGIIPTIGLATATTRICPVCNGSKLLARPIINDKNNQV